MSRQRATPNTDLGGRLRAKLSPLGNAQAMDAGPFDRLVARVRRPLDRIYLRRLGSLGRLTELADAARRVPTDGPASARVLVLALRGWPAHNAVEAVIAQALRLRGAEVGLLTCGGGQPICELGWGRRVFPRPCDRCGWYTDQVIAAMGLPAFRLADGFAWGTNASRAATAAPDGDAAAGPGAVSAPWVLKTTDARRHPEGRDVIADFEAASGAVAEAAREVLDRFSPDVVFMVNGLFASERVVRELALGRRLRAPTYEMAPRGGALCFSQHAPAPDHNTDHIWAAFGDRPLRADQESALDRLLADRARGVGAHERYYDDPEEDAAALRSRLGIPPGRRVLSLFTNLSWDSAGLYHDVAYPSMLDWVEHAVRAAAGANDAMLVVRVHPAERRWGTREEVEATLRERLGGELPAKVRLIRPDEPLSSYALLDMSELCLTYTTTLGVEAAVRGVPVAVAGLSHYRGRGFTLDIDNPRQLERLVRESHGRLEGARLDLARRYAFAYFFRAMIPFAPVRLVGGRPDSVADSVDALMPGRDPLLDWICERILDGGEFGLPDELATLTQPGPA